MNEKDPQTDDPPSNMQGKDLELEPPGGGDTLPRSCLEDFRDRCRAKAGPLFGLFLLMFIPTFSIWIKGYFSPDSTLAPLPSPRPPPYPKRPTFSSLLTGGNTAYPSLHAPSPSSLTFPTAASPPHQVQGNSPFIIFSPPSASAPNPFQGSPSPSITPISPPSTFQGRPFPPIAPFSPPNPFEGSPFRVYLSHLFHLFLLPISFRVVHPRLLYMFLLPILFLEYGFVWFDFN